MGVKAGKRKYINLFKAQFTLTGVVKEDVRKIKNMRRIHHVFAGFKTEAATWNGNGFVILKCPASRS